MRKLSRGIAAAGTVAAAVSLAAACAYGSDPYDSPPVPKPGDVGAAGVTDPAVNNHGSTLHTFPPSGKKIPVAEADSMPIEHLLDSTWCVHKMYPTLTGIRVIAGDGPGNRYIAAEVDVYCVKALASHYVKLTIMRLDDGKTWQSDSSVIPNRDASDPAIYVTKLPCEPGTYAMSYLGNPKAVDLATHLTVSSPYGNIGEAVTVAASDCE